MMDLHTQIENSAAPYISETVQEVIVTTMEDEQNLANSRAQHLRSNSSANSK
jgi:hypothetical protein